MRDPLRWGPNGCAGCVVGPRAPMGRGGRRGVSCSNRALNERCRSRSCRCAVVFRCVRNKGRSRRPWVYPRAMTDAKSIVDAPRRHAHRIPRWPLRPTIALSGDMRNLACPPVSPDAGGRRQVRTGHNPVNSQPLRADFRAFAQKVTEIRPSEHAP